MVCPCRNSLLCTENRRIILHISHLIYIYKDFASLKTDVAEGDENKSELDIESLEVFENIAYIMAKHADPENVSDSPDDFLERFNTFSIYEILPQLIELWGLNTATQVESKKNIARLTDR